ncbi:hypothetical protein JCM16303_001545 [Sporobolomyces ruberrimus]
MAQPAQQRPNRPRLPPPPPPPPPAPAPGPPNSLLEPMLEPMRRPRRDPYELPANTMLQVKTNTFRVSIHPSEQTWWKYEVVVATAARLRTDGTVDPPKPLPKSLLWKVWEELETNHRARFGGVLPASDGRNAIYTNRQLLIEGISLADRRRSSFTVTIQNPIRIPLSSLRNYVANTGEAHLGEVNDALQALNVLFRHGPSLAFPSTRTAFFPMDTTNPASRDDRKIRLGQGIHLWRGFFQSVRPCARDLQLNLDTTSGAFVQCGDLVGLVFEWFKDEPRSKVRDIRDLNTNLVNNVTAQTWITINRVLRKVRIKVDRGTAVPRDKSRYMRMELRGRGIVSNASAASFRFEVNGRTTTVAEFFLTTYGNRLSYPELPLVEIKSGVLVPMELISIEVGNKWSKRLSPSQQVLASPLQHLKPADRLRQIGQMRRTLSQGFPPQYAARPQPQPQIASFGVALEATETTADARTLPTPGVEYRRSEGPVDSYTRVSPRQGAWQQQRPDSTSHEKFLATGPVLKSAVVVLANLRMVGLAKEWFGAFLPVCKLLGIGIDNRVVETAHNGLLFVDRVPDTRAVNGVAPTITKARAHAEDRFGGGAQIIFWLFDTEGSSDYDVFKFESVRGGIASQALLQKTLRKGTRDFSLQLNCALKLNVKLGGYNFRLERAPNTTMGQRQPMFFGADLSHEPDKPSIAVVTASMQPDGIAHEEQIRIQALVEPSPTAPPDTPARRQEIIVDLEDMVFELLVRRIVCRSTCPPEAIVFFRDGVSESEVGKVLQSGKPNPNSLRDSASEEHRLFRESLMQKVGKTHEEKLARVPEVLNALVAWQPKLTFILTIKPHHVRAFVNQGPGNINQGSGNIAPGTVIDTEIVDARAADFYLASHKGIIGTTRPTRYFPLVDDNNLSPDAIQGLCNDVAYTYQRCTRAVSLPASVYYADLIGRRVHGWMKAEDIDDGASNDEDASASDDDDTSQDSHRPATSRSRRRDLKKWRRKLAKTVVGRLSFRAHGEVPAAMWWL